VAALCCDRGEEFCWVVYGGLVHWQLLSLNDDQARQPPAFTNSIAMGSLSDDLREIMKTLASNIMTLQ
jgi:hypothetical protein